MYPEEGKKIGRTKNVLDESDRDFYYSRTNSVTTITPHPPPRHKQEIVKTSNFNLIEF